MVSQEEKLYQNLVDMLDLVRELVASCFEKGWTEIHPNVIQIASSFLSTMDKDILIDNFISRSYFYWDQIKKKDEDFFFDNAHKVFTELPSDQVQAFTVLFTAHDDDKLIVSEEDRESVWEYLHCMVKISIAHVFNKRKVNHHYMSNIDVNRSSKLYGVNL